MPRKQLHRPVKNAEPPGQEAPPSTGDFHGDELEADDTPVQLPPKLACLGDAGDAAQSWALFEQLAALRAAGRRCDLADAVWSSLGRLIAHKLLADTSERHRLLLFQAVGNMLRQSARRGIKVVPICHVGARHIMLDSTYLRQLCVNVRKNRKPGDPELVVLSRDEFNHNRLAQWRRFFKLPASWFLTEEELTKSMGVAQTRRLFQGTATTDGVSISLIFRRWYLCPKPPLPKVPMTKDECEAERKAWLEGCCYTKTAVVGVDPGTKTAVVGVDPGKKSVVTWVGGAMDLSGGDAIRVAKQPRKELCTGSLSARKYQNDSHVEKWNLRTRHQLQERGLAEFAAEIPSVKSVSLADYQDYAEYVEPRLEELADVRCSKAWKRAALDVHVMRDRVMDRTIRSIVESSGCRYKDRDRVLVAIGSAAFGNLKGQRPTPSGRRFVARMRKAHGLDVLPVWEFNTSQVCSRCHATRRLTDAPSATFPYFVRVCTDTDCVTEHWNRDVNAARNMRYLAAEELLGHERPTLFSQKLPSTAEPLFRGPPAIELLLRGPPTTG